MVFGSNQFFETLRNGMLCEAGQNFYSVMLKTIEGDIKPRVSTFVPYPENEDVTQQILLSVWLSMSQFVRKSADLSPAQRNSWLMRIVNNKIADYYRAKYTVQEDFLLDVLLEQPSAEKDNPFEMIEIEESNEIDIQRVDSILMFICSLKIPPEKIIAFIYSKIIFFLNSSGMIKGSAKYAYDKINGRSFGELLPKLKEDLNNALGRQVPQSIYDSLRNKIEVENMDCILNIELQTITDSTRYIIKRVRNAVSLQDSR